MIIYKKPSQIIPKLYINEYQPTSLSCLVCCQCQANYNFNDWWCATGHRVNSWQCTTGALQVCLENLPGGSTNICLLNTIFDYSNTFYLSVCGCRSSNYSLPTTSCARIGLHDGCDYRYLFLNSSDANITTSFKNQYLFVYNRKINSMDIYVNNGTTISCIACCTVGWDIDNLKIIANTSKSTSSGDGGGYMNLTIYRQNYMNSKTNSLLINIFCNKIWNTFQ